MITTLHIKNIGIIDDLSIELGEGLNVLTGETGAGKTLIIDAINIISGGRFSKEMIRKGESYSFVEVNLYLPNNPMSIENNIIVSREIHLNGKNSCKINGRLVTLTELKEFMSNIIDIHGQNDNQKILNSKYHIKYLDNFIGEELLNIKKQYKELYKKRIEIKKELKDNLGDDKEKQRKLDLLKYQFDEIDLAKLKENEEEELEGKRKLFMNSEKIGKSLNSADLALGEGAIDKINEAIRAIEKISDIDKVYEEKLTELKSIYYEVQELSRDISSLNSEMYFDENERNETEERLDLINSLKRKYGNSIIEILEYKNNIEKEIERINNLDEYNAKLKEKIKALEKEMQKLATKMHNIRVNIAQKLNENINKELKDLEMPNAKFYVEIKETEFNKNGIDEIEFFISTNIGEDSKPLAKIASGGEMSRIMLAIKTVLANTDSTPILIFDEIDTGISGKAAKSVGEKLKIIGNSHQVLCITHQPSIAAKGDQNFYISKVSEEGRTYTKVKKLNEEEIIKEIARIANGEITDIALKHAIELRKTA